MLEQLISLGLREDEARVYLALLQLGGGYASSVAKRAEKNRATCYHTLATLAGKGHVSNQLRGSCQFFLPEPPEKILEIEKRRLETAEKLLPELRSILNTLKRKPAVKFFEGRKGIEGILEDFSRAEDGVVGFTNVAAVLELFPDSFTRHIRENARRRIPTRYISPRPADPPAVLRQLTHRIAQPHLIEVLFVNPGQFPFENEIAVCGDRVAVMSLSKEEMIAISIESPHVSRSFRSLFDLAWLGATSFIAV